MSTDGAATIIRGVPLPPKASRPTPSSITQLERALTGFIAGHPDAVTGYTFYEVIDQYLGPWNEKGYPIAYGKYYYLKFNDNAALQADPVTRDWTRRIRRPSRAIPGRIPARALSRFS
jgi:hypothetical protein